MTTYKALIADIDGTIGIIGTDGSDIGLKDKEMVKKAVSQGKKITCATGRGWPKTKPVVKRLGITDPCIIQGGSCIIDPKTEKILWEMSLDKSQTKIILGIIKKLATDKTTYVTLDKSQIPVAQLTDVNGSNRIIYLLGVDDDTAEKVIKEVNKTDFAIAHKTAPSWYGPEYADVHVTSPSGTKEHAIQQWQKMTGVKKQETIGLGDSENDLPLFESVGLKLAVANAHINLKHKADKIVESYSRGGFREAIAKYLIS